MAYECHIDYETFSEADLPKVGAYRYAEDPSTEVLLTSYYVKGWPSVRQWDATAEPEMPSDLAALFADPDCVFVAWNASFERQITRYVLRIDLPVSRWRCAERIG